MKKTIELQHMSISIKGILQFYRRRSMAGLFTKPDGAKASDKEVRDFINEHIRKGHTCMPMGNPKDCPDFDYTGGGCPGHGIRYFDDANNQISKEEYDSLISSLKHESNN